MRKTACLIGLAALGAYGNAALPYTRTEDFAPVAVVRRSRLSAEPQLYAEFLCKYGMYQNYLHYWIDRPLFCNRAMRPAEFAHETAQSFAVPANNNDTEKDIPTDITLCDRGDDFLYSIRHLFHRLCRWAFRDRL